MSRIRVPPEAVLFWKITVLGEFGIVLYSTYIALLHFWANFGVLSTKGVGLARARVLAALHLQASIQQKISETSVKTFPLKC